MSATDLAQAPICPERGVDVVAPRNRRCVRNDVTVTRGGSILLPIAVVIRMRLPAVVLWKYLGRDGFNIIEANDWDHQLGSLYAVEAPRLEHRETRYRVRFPAPYVVALKPQTSAVHEITEHDGRMVLSLFGVLDAERLHRAW